MRMKNIINNLANSITEKETAPKLITGTGQDKTYLCVVMTADRGLCGGFNTNICRLAKVNFEKILKEGKTLKIITVGSKGLDQIKRDYGKHVIQKLSFKDRKKISFREAEEVGKIILDLFYKNEFDICLLFFNNFKNVITQIPQAQQIIPAKKEKSSSEPAADDFYEFEPDEDEILENLLPKNISTQIFKAFLENAASEQGSRMTAMDNATRNAGELVELKDLISNDPDKFLKNELLMRKKNNLPPFQRFISLIITGSDEKKAELESIKFKEFIEKQIKDKILGPVNAPIFRIKRKYRLRLLVRGRKSLNLQSSLSKIISKYKFPHGIKLTVDVDPITFN